MRLPEGVETVKQNFQLTCGVITILILSVLVYLIATNYQTIDDSTRYLLQTYSLFFFMGASFAVGIAFVIFILKYTISMFRYLFEKL